MKLHYLIDLEREDRNLESEVVTKNASQVLATPETLDSTYGDLSPKNKGDYFCAWGS